MTVGLWADILQWAGALTIVAGALAALVKGGRWVSSLWRKIDLFLDDWNGEPARPGREAVPGVLQRLVVLEQLAQHVAHEVTPNSGSSMKDSLARLEVATGADTNGVPVDNPHARTTNPVL